MDNNNKLDINPEPSGGWTRDQSQSHHTLAVCKKRTFKFRRAYVGIVHDVMLRRMTKAAGTFENLKGKEIYIRHWPRKWILSLDLAKQSQGKTAFTHKKIRAMFGKGYHRDTKTRLYSSLLCFLFCMFFVLVCFGVCITHILQLISLFTRKYTCHTPYGRHPILSSH